MKHYKAGDLVMLPYNHWRLTEHEQAIKVARIQSVKLGGVIIENGLFFPYYMVRLLSLVEAVLYDI